MEVPQKLPPSKGPQAGAAPKTEMSSGMWALIIAGVFVLVVAAGVGLPLLFGQGAPASSGDSAALEPVPTRPAATAVVQRATSSIPTTALATVNPAGDVPTPPPDWDKLYASVAALAGGWELLILETGDTWGYLRPCG